jgi:hypothetical protein
VKENADILVLIIGARYGSIIDNGKSITNNEFLVARQKGIPIFCFIDRHILSALDFWKSNRNANFTYIVDNVQIFEFIDEIRNNSKIWTFPFERAQEIVSTLKIQLSYLFKSSLIAKKIFDNEIPDIFKLNLSDKSLKILLEKKVSTFEHAFLAQVFVDEIEKKEFIRNDIEYSILTEPKHFIRNHEEIPDWVRGRISSITNIISSLSSIVNVALPKFLGEPGEPADLKGIYYVSIKYSELYEQLLNWIIVTRSTQIDEDFIEAKMILSRFASQPSKAIWDFPFDIKKQIDSANEKIRLGERGISLNMTLTIEIEKGVEDDFNTIFEKLRQYYEI